MAPHDEETETRNIEWATKIFRPLLKDLDISHLAPTGNVQILTADYVAFIRRNMDRCVVVVCYHKLTQNYHQGLFIWQYNATENFYALYIVLNCTLQSTPIIRKAVSVHEYVHCVAAMLALSRLETPRLIDILHSKMSKRFHILTSIDISKILKDLKKSSDLDTFDDSHFRIEWEDFQASYSELYRNLLLSYELFCENGFFDKAARATFFQHIKQKNSEEAIKVLFHAMYQITFCKSLDQNFVAQRVWTEFLPLILTSK